MLILSLILLIFLVLFMADLPAATPLTNAGVLVSGAQPTAAALTQTFANAGKTLVLVENGSGAPITATFVTAGVEEDDGGDLAIEDRVVTVAAGETKIVGPFKPSIFNDPATDKITLTISAITDVTLRAVSVATYATRE
jgi:hypothetical protein